MSKLLTAAGAVAAVAFASQALADSQERWPRWYVGLSGGMAFLDDSDVSGGATGELKYGRSGMAALSLGYMPPSSMQPLSNMRFDIELGYHSSPLDSLVLSGTPTTTSGDLQVVSYMANAYYDFRNTSRFTPYLGAGAGGASVHLSKSSGLGNTDSRDNVFAYQFMGGVAYAPVSMPMTEWNLGYRYFVANSPEFDSAGGAIELDDYKTHNIEVGGRFRF